MSILLSVTFLLLAGVSAAAQAGRAPIDYLGQTPPGDAAVLFAPGIVSTRDLHSRLAISPDGKRMCWTRITGPTATDMARVHCIENKDGRWTRPQTLPVAPDTKTANALFSPDGTKLFFEHKETADGRWITKYVEKTDSGWSAPKTDGFLLKTHSSFTENGKVYYTDSLAGKPWGRGVYRAEFIGSAYLNPKPLDASINSPYIDYTFYVSPDESYLMWSSSRPSQGENMFLHISFRNENGVWSTPIRMHDALKFPGPARFPSISPDGKYLFFCGDDGNMYWASLSVIEKLRKEAQWPVLSFTESGQQLTPAIGRGVALGDFNGDGFADAFVSNGSGFQVYFGDGKGKFTESGQHLTTPVRGWSKPVIGDINGDRRLEVITGSTVWLNDGQGGFTAHPELIESSEGGNLSAVALADLNGDGHLDLFAIRNYAAMRVYLNNGHGCFTDSGQRLGDGAIGKGQVVLIALGDLDGDKSIDAVTAGWRWDGSVECPNRVWLNDGKGNFRDSGQLLDEGQSHVHGLALGDLNGDGRPDLVMGIQDRARSGRFYFNGGNGRFTAGANLDGVGGENVALGDLNGDGRLDVFAAHSTPPSRVWLNNGTGALRDSGLRLGSNCTWDVALGDINGDGRLDAFTVGFVWGSNDLTPAPARVWLNGGAK